MRLLHLATIAFAVLAACGDATNGSKPSTLDTSLRAIAAQAELDIIDMSVPFERLLEAPARLQAVNEALQKGPPGVYVMRYADDTLRQTLHVFIIGSSQRVYVKLTTTPGQSIVEERFDIHGGSYEETTQSLVLDTNAGVVRLAPQDVTPVGA